MQSVCLEEREGESQRMWDLRGSGVRIKGVGFFLLGSWEAIEGLGQKVTSYNLSFKRIILLLC